mmetsp:Transcript_64933/g.152755  ORF Transcript_64933/g.152755 Transcript_64933/m.152755 type:complete len:803 (-) Transcript_64933:214-2622(-)
MRNFDTVPKNVNRQQNKARTSFAIDSFVQKGVQWPLAVFIVSVAVIGLLLRALDGLFFSEEETSSCCWEIGLCAAATFGLAVAAGPTKGGKATKAAPKQPAAGRITKPLSKQATDDEAKVAEIINDARRGDLVMAEAKVMQLRNSWRLSNGEVAETATSSKVAHVNAIIQACVDANDAKRAGAWVLLLPRTPKSLQIVADALVKEGNMAEAEDVLCKAICCPAYIVGPSLPIIFRHVIHPAELPKLEGFLKNLQAQSSRHLLFGYAAILRTSRFAASTERIEYWMDRAQDEQVPAEALLFNAAIGACAALGEPMKAEMWLNRMMAHVAPDASCCSAVVSAFISSNKTYKAEQYLKRVKAGELQLDTAAFNQIIKACIQAEDMVAADQWLSAATSCGAPLESLCVHTVVGAALRFAKAKIAERWLCSVAEKGILCDSSSFNAVISCYAKAGNAEAAERIVNFMCKNNIEPDVITLGAAVHAFARAGQPKQAEQMFELILTRGKTRPDVIGFNALIDASVKVGDTSRAEFWLERMLEMGLEPSVVSYTTVLHAHAKEGNIEAAETTMKLMKDHGIEANVVTYTALVNACVKAGEIACAERWFDEMKTAGVQANAVSYSALLNVCAKAGDFKRAERFLERMVREGVPPTEVCFNNVIDACSKAGQASRAEYWLWRLAGEGQGPISSELSPTRQSFTAAAQAHAKVGSFGDVERLFRAMEARGISMDAFCLTVQLSAYARARPRQRERLEETLRKYHSQGLVVTKPPLRVAKSVLGALRFEQLCAEMGLKVPDLNDFGEERRPGRR